MLEDLSPNAAALPANKASHVRRYNRRVLLHALRLSDGLSRVELARATGLTRQAIANIVEELIAAGLVREVGRRKTRRGQPPIVVELAKEGGFAVGVRIDVECYDAVVVDLAGDPIETRHGRTPAHDEDGMLDFLTRLHGELARRHGAERCLGLGLVTPGPFDARWPGAPIPGAIPALQSRLVAAALAARTGTDVLLENDATAAALGEKLYGEARNLTNFFFVFVGEGVGGGMVVNGDPYRGTRGNAGELGHLVVDPSGPACYCGNRGCLGEYASLGSLARMLAEDGAGDRPDARAAVEERWLDGAARALSIALAGVENLLDPETVILGGTAPPDLLRRLLARLDPLRPSVRAGLEGERLRLSALGERSAALGASALPLLAATSPSPLQLVGGGIDG